MTTVQILPAQLNAAHSRIRAHFDDGAADYRKGSQKVQWQGPRALFDALKRRADLQKDGLKSLDLGAGTGEVGELLKQENSSTEVTGVDLSEAELEIALKEQFIDAAKVGLVTDLGWAQTSAYDLVTSCGVFDFLSDEEVSNVASSIARVTKPGGIIGFTFEPEGSAHPGPKGNSRFEEQELCAKFRAVGINILDVETLHPAWLLGKGQRPVENRIIIGQAPLLN